MAEERRLESLLDQLAGELEWPPTPDLRPAVRRRTRWRGPGLPVLLLAAALAAALVATLAVGAYLGLRGASISRAPSLPSPPAVSSPTPPTGVAGRLNLGMRYGTVEEAATAAGFQPPVPQSLGAPDEVYYLSSRHTVTLLYHPRPGLPASEDPEVGALVMEAPASLPDQPFVKVVDPKTSVKPVTVNGGPGYWISGAPHAYFFYRGGMDDRFRLAGNVLIWNQGSLVIRIESSLGQDEAMGVAHSIR